jgi:hypothetical protein
MPLSATTLTLPCHKVELRPVAAHAGLCTLFESACRGLSITPEQLRWELEENGDIANLVSGALRPAASRLIAETLDTMQYAGGILESAPAKGRRRAVLFDTSSKFRYHLSHCQRY